MRRGVAVTSYSSDNEHGAWIHGFSHATDRCQEPAAHKLIIRWYQYMNRSCDRSVNAQWQSMFHRTWQSTARTRDRLVFSATLLLGAVGVLLLLLASGRVTALVSGLALIVAISIWALRFPDMVLILLTCLVFDGFGYIPVMKRMRLSAAGGATPAELILAVILVIALLRYFQCNRSVSWIRECWLLLSVNVVILLYVVFLIMYSYLAGRASLTQALNVGGGNFTYYGVFLYAMFTLRGPEQIRGLLMFIRVAAVVVAVTSIGSTVVGRPLAPYVFASEFGDIWRMGIPGYSCCVFVVVYGYLEMTERQRPLLFISAEVLLSFLGFIYYLARIWTVGLLGMLVISGILARRFFFSTVVIAFLILLALLAPLLPLRTITGDIARRGVETRQELAEGTSTFHMRLEQIAMGFDVFKRTPFLGTGFVREDSPYWEKHISHYGHAVTYCADYGLPSILYTTGLVGFSLISGFVIVVLRQLMICYRRCRDSDVKRLLLTVAVVLGVDYFFSQLGGNFFGYRWVAFYMLLIGLAFKAFYVSQQAPLIVYSGVSRISANKRLISILLHRS